MKNYFVIAALLMSSVIAEDVPVPSSDQPDAIAEKHGSDEKGEEVKGEDEDEDDKDLDEEEDGDIDEKGDDKDLDENDDDLEADELEQEHDHHEHEDDNMEYYFRYGVKNISHDDKHEDKHPGEDAWLAQSDLLLVADGVGGWEEHGVDSSQFS